MTPAQQEQFEIQKELLELAIKAGRRMMHDYKHLLNEVPEDTPFKKEFKERGEMWEAIFYPDDGMKNYRSRLHLTIDRLDVSLSVARDLLKKHGIESSPHEPF